MTTILKESISIVIFREFFLIFHSEEGIYPFVLSLLKHIEKWDYWCSHKAELGQQKKKPWKKKKKKILLFVWNDELLAQFFRVM